MDFYHYKKMMVEKWWWFERKDALITMSLPLSWRENHNRDILEIGAEISGAFENEFPDRYVMDIDQRSLDKLKNVRNKIRWDAQEKFPFEKKFDAIIMADVLEHIDNDNSVIRNCFDVLKDDGLMLIVVPAMPTIYGPHDVALKHKRRYTRMDVMKLVRGFNIVKFTYWNCILSPFIVFSRFMQKYIHRRGTDIVRLPRLVDYSLKLILGLENYMIYRGFSFPIGLSIFVVAKK